jgi:DMSO reductase anchor subunit
MSNKQNEISVSLVSTLVILAYYLVNIFQMLQSGGLNSAEVFRLWAVVIIATIILNIAGNIITNIVINIVHAIKTQKEEEVRMLEDERDKLIGLKGDRVSYLAFSIGVFLSMLTFALGQPPLVMFSLIVFSSLMAEIFGDLSQFYFYRRGA